MNKKKDKQSTNSLEKSGELVDLSTTEIDESNPYGKHMQTICVEVFSKGQFIYILDSKGNTTWRSMFMENDREQKK